MTINFLTEIKKCLVFMLALVSNQRHYQDILLIEPVSLHSPKFSVETIERFCEDEFILSYEIKESSKVSAAKSSHQLTLIYTNSFHQAVFRNRIVAGSFWTKAAFDRKSRECVLNETAAFKLFGSAALAGLTIRFNNTRGLENWLITGVIDDGDGENNNVYASANAVSAGGANAGASNQALRIGSLYALLNPESDVTEAYAKNVLKKTGVHEGAFTFSTLTSR